MSHEITPFEQIRRTNPAGNEFWSSRDFSRVLGYVNYRHFLAVIEKARTACFNSGQRVEDHFVGIDDMIGIGNGQQRRTMQICAAVTGLIHERDPSLNVCHPGGTVPA
jgi:DNA-damage-inducible protein D